MSVKSHTDKPKRAFSTRALYVLGLSAWVFGAAIAAQVLLVLVAFGLGKLGIDFSGIDGAVGDSIIALFAYLLTLALIIGLPWFAMHRRTSLKDLGLTRLPSWLDILVGPLGIVPYVILSGLLLIIAANVIPGFDGTQQQVVGFTSVVKSYEYILAFITLVCLAPLAEEMVFRGYLYGKLRQHLGMWASVLMTSVVFAALHGQWNVGIDVFALSIVLSLLRETTGSIWAGVLLHMTKNAIAFYFLFINTGLADTLLR